MKAGTILVALIVAAACISGIVWLAAGSGAVDLSSPKPNPNAQGLPIAETGPYPKAVLPEKVHSFEVMAVNTEKSHKFIVKNEGEAPLKLKIKGTSCTCTLSDLAKDEIPVGEEGEVELKWIPRSPDMAFEKHAEVWTNDPANPIINFTIRGKVANVFEVVPQGGWSLENMERTKPEIMVGEVASAVLEDFKITSIDKSNEFLQVGYEPLPPDELVAMSLKCGYRITVTLDPKQLNVGKIEESITVHTDVEEAKDVVFSITGKFLGSITALPYIPDGKSGAGMIWERESLYLQMGQVPSKTGGEGWYKLVVADMPEGETFEVSKIESSEEYVTATVEPLPNPPNSSRQQFLITFNVKPGIPPGGYDRKQSVKILLKTNHPFAPEIKFYLGFTAN